MQNKNILVKLKNFIKGGIDKIYLLIQLILLIYKCAIKKQGHPLKADGPAYILKAYNCRYAFCGLSWWRRRGLNSRPPDCEPGALPAELRPRINWNITPVYSCWGHFSIAIGVSFVGNFMSEKQKRNSGEGSGRCSVSYCMVLEL